ncbi:glycosyltransferase [Desulfosporosinus meridiei]|uniref:Glycosyltransferase n=1 Tax=Desulfosporosinus meridiei (strain ATCC BAA-275 / DSM 13257 / KCTC 12902 / NCIMB 13706 / S10) TaxID=768704 RepID=J7J5C0_DESMD|nr:glycosyltransferase [Desulfosporosinus meridiei]AFQ46141.1 glycosyltransferase [Desulfosporosinus meridiei DSM 13257]
MAKLCLLANAASTHTEKWATALAEGGWELEILSFLPAEIPQVKVHLIPRLAGDKIDVILRQNWVRKKVAEIKPDLIHSHYATSFGLLGALTGKHPLVISAWGSDIFSFPKTSFFHARLLKWILAQADVLCSSSKIMAQEMQLYLDSQQAIEIIPFGVDTKRFSPPEEGQVSSLKRVKQDTPVVFGVAKGLHPVYGLDLLIEAFALVQRRFPQTLLRIAGEGPQRASLEDLAVRLGVSEHIEWLGQLPNAEIAGFYQSIDIVVIPSRQESFGVTAVEASACARPVIASRIGGLTEVIVEGETGLLVSSESISELSSAMEGLLNDPTLRERLGQQGRVNVLKNYDWQKNVAQMEAVYQRLLHPRT